MLCVALLTLPTLLQAQFYPIKTYDETSGIPSSTLISEPGRSRGSEHPAIVAAAAWRGIISTWQPR